MALGDGARAQSLNLPTERAAAPAVSLTLYSEPNFRGASRRFFMDEADLTLVGFQGFARSARIARDGRWRLCSAAHYRGRCVSLDGSLKDLGRVGLDRTVASVWRQ